MMQKRSFIETALKKMKGSTDRRWLLSCLECEGFAAGFSMDKGHAWEAVPTLLEENAAAPPQITRTKEGMVKRRYRVEAVVEQVERRKPLPRREEEQRRARARG